jgi:hypothetical protein
MRNGFSNFDEEQENCREKHISVDDAMADFYFVGGKLIIINFGVLLTTSEMKPFSS